MLKLRQKDIAERDRDRNPFAVRTDLYLQSKGESNNITRNTATDLAVRDCGGRDGPLFKASLQKRFRNIGAQQILQRYQFTRLHANQDVGCCRKFAGWSPGDGTVCGGWCFSLCVNRVREQTQTDYEQSCGAAEVRESPIHRSTDPSRPTEKLPN